MFLVCSMRHVMSPEPRYNCIEAKLPWPARRAAFVSLTTVKRDYVKWRRRRKTVRVQVGARGGQGRGTRGRARALVATCMQEIYLVLSMSARLSFYSFDCVNFILKAHSASTVCVAQKSLLVRVAGATHRLD